MPAPQVVIQITSTGAERVRREIEQLRRLSTQQAGQTRAATSAYDQQARAAAATSRQIIAAQRATTQYVAGVRLGTGQWTATSGQILAAQRNVRAFVSAQARASADTALTAKNWSMTSAQVLAAQRNVRAFQTAQAQTTAAASATTKNWNLTSSQILAAQRNVRTFVDNQARAGTAARQAANSWALTTTEIRKAQQAVAAYTQQATRATQQASAGLTRGGISTVLTGRAVTAGELGGVRAGAERMQAASIREVDKAQKELNQTTAAQARTVALGQRSWNSFRSTLGGTDRVLAQVAGAKNRLRAAVAAGTISQVQANQALRVAITHYRDSAKAASAFRGELRTLVQLAAGQAVAGAIPGIGGFALGSAIGRQGLAIGGGVVGGIATAAAIASLASAGDQLRLLRAQLRAFSTDSAAAEATFGGLVATSRETGTALQSNAVLVRRLTQAQKDLRASTADIIGFQDIVQKLMIASGVATTEAAGGTLQLSQALASGKVQGDEFRSVMENMTAVARVAAQGLYEMGKLTRPTIGELNRLREAGQLTSRDFFRAVLTQGEKANELFAKMPDTIGRAATGVGNEFLLMAGRLGESTGATDLFIASLRTLESLLRTIADISDITITIYPKTVPGTERGEFDLERMLESRINTELARLGVARPEVRAALSAGRETEEIGGLFTPAKIIGQLPEPVPRGRERGGSDAMRARVSLLEDQLALTKDIVAAEYRSVDAVNEAELMMRATLEARQKGLSLESDEIRLLMQISRIERERAIGAAARGERFEQERLRIQAASGGRMTEDVRIALRKSEVLEQRGPAGLFALRGEIEKTERARTGADVGAATTGIREQLEDTKLLVEFGGQQTEEYRRRAAAIALERQQLAGVDAEQQKILQQLAAQETLLQSIETTLGLKEQLQDIQLLNQFGGQQTEQYRVQAGLLELNRETLGNVTAEQEALVRATEAEVSARASGDLTRTLEEQIEDLQLAARYAYQETEEYKVQAEILSGKRKLLTDLTDEQKALVAQVERESRARAVALEKTKLQNQAAGQRQELGFAQESALSEMLGLGTPEELRVQQQLLAIRQNPELGPDAAAEMEPLIRQTESLNSQLTLTQDIIPSLASSLTDLGRTTVFEGPEEAARQFTEQLALMAAQAAITAAALALVQAAMGGGGAAGAVAPPGVGPGGMGFVGPGAGLGASGFGGPRQHGGPAYPGLAYQLHGPEIFVPRVPGQITPNAAIKPQVIVNDMRTSQSAAPVETHVDARGVATVFVRDQIVNMARNGSLQRLAGTRRQGVARG